LDKPYKGKKEFNLDFLFIEIGQVIEAGLAKNIGVNLNEKKEIIIDNESKTNIDGFFAAGDCCNRVFKQAITGVAEGVIASFSAYEYLKISKGKV